MNGATVQKSKKIRKSATATKNLTLTYMNVSEG